MGILRFVILFNGFPFFVYTAWNSTRRGSNNQPHIILFSDEDYEDEDRLQQFFVCVEQTLILECSNIVAAIFFCIGAHYIFNLNYHPKSGTFKSSILSPILFFLAFRGESVCVCVCGGGK